MHYFCNNLETKPLLEFVATKLKSLFLPSHIYTKTSLEKLMIVNNLLLNFREIFVLGPQSSKNSCCFLIYITTRLVFITELQQLQSLNI